LAYGRKNCLARRWRKQGLLRNLAIVALPPSMSGELAMVAQNATIDLFSALAQRFSALLFAHAKPVHLVGRPGAFCRRRSA
jgi:hypothetical protein